MTRTRCASAMALSALVAVTTVWLSSSHIHAADWKVPRTSWGAPDFEGITWNFATMTPLERPRGIEKAELTAQETVVFERDTATARAANVNNGYDWWDPGAAHLDRRRTSLIIDPTDGRLPPKVASASGRARRAAIEGPEDFPLNTRCMAWSNAVPPMTPSPYNNNVQFIETRDYVVISNENIHDARIIPLDGRPHGTASRWLGDSRGHWDGDTLVVDTTNFTTKTDVAGSDVNLHVVERFTRVDADAIDYQFTVDDPTVWAQSWTAVLRLHRTDEPIYEFACHEGNGLIMEDMLRVARMPETP